MTISTPQDLIDFIEQDSIDFSAANKIVCKALNVLQPYMMTKETLIQITNEFISRRTGTDDTPIFLQQREPDFKLQDITRFWTNK
jgi:hypothetical protein